MAISSIVTGALSGASSAASSAAKAGRSTFAELFERAKEAQPDQSQRAVSGASTIELTREAENRLSEFKRAFEQLLSTAGIDTTWQIRLQSDGQGGLVVNGDHPQAEEIQALLRSNPDLIEKFTEVQHAFQRLRSSTASDDEQTGGFALLFEDGGVQPTFD